MVKTVLLVMFSVFSVMGVTEFIHGIKLKLLSVEKEPAYANVIVLKDDIALGQLSFAYSQLRWWGRDYCNVIIAVTDNLSEDTLEECRFYSRKRKIVLVPSEYINNVLDSVI